MPKRVVKFGGSNLKTKEDIAKLIRVVRLYKQDIVIVVSALYGVTDSLIRTLHEAKNDESVIQSMKDNLEQAHTRIIDLYITDAATRETVLNQVNARIDELGKYLRGIHYLGDIPDFVEDRVLSYGERLSSLVLTCVLNYNDIPCRECMPEELGLLTNGEYRNATVDFSLSRDQVQHVLSGDIISVVPGFYGISHKDSRVTLFGRGGTDYTAAAVARCIDAASVDLWKDVNGFMSADPKLVDNPTVINRLNYNEAAELSYFGARILHPRAFEPVEETHIPIRIFNIDNFSEDLTPVTIIAENGVIKKDIIKSVTFSDDFGILQLHGPGVGIKPGIMAKVTAKLSDEGINIKSIITSQTSINILLARQDLAVSAAKVQDVGLTAVDRISTFDDISVIAVVGEGILEKPGIAARTFSAVSQRNINVRLISAGASSVAIYFIVDKHEQRNAVKAIHQEFFG